LDSISLIPEQVLTPMLLLRAASGEGESGATTYAIDVEDAREILPERATTRLPGAPAYVLGLINVRGTIVTVIDLARRLEPQTARLAVAAGPSAATHVATTPEDEGAILLVRRGSGLVGFAVREVLDVRPLDLSEIESAILSAGAVRGVVHLDGAPVVVLDVHALIKQVLLA
jgi:purine-binding chemotaxis protein CheW